MKFKDQTGIQYFCHISFQNKDTEFYLFISGFKPERLSSHSKEAGLVIYLAFLAKVANLYYIILTAFKKYWPDTVAKFISGTQDTFI